MDGDQLFWFYRNPQYVEAVERNLRESSELSELLERMNWLPRTLEEKETLESQTAKWKARSCSGQGVERKLACQLSA